MSLISVKRQLTNFKTNKASKLIILNFNSSVIVFPLNVLISELSNTQPAEKVAFVCLSKTSLIKMFILTLILSPKSFSNLKKSP